MKFTLFPSRNLAHLDMKVSAQLLVRLGISRCEMSAALPMMFVDATQELVRDPVQYYLRDGLHLTADGKQVLSTIVAKAVLGLGQGNW